MSLRSVEAEHGGELGDVVLHGEARVSGPGDGGQTPELTILQLRERQEDEILRDRRWAVLPWPSRAR